MGMYALDNVGENTVLSLPSLPTLTCVCTLNVIRSIASVHVWCFWSLEYLTMYAHSVNAYGNMASFLHKRNSCGVLLGWGKLSST